MDNSSKSDACSTPEKTKRINSKTYSHKKQNFRNEWLSNKEYSNWLLPAHNNKLLAKCKICTTEMTAELSVIKNMLQRKNIEVQ